jgi:HK97 family phage portal protein
MAWNWLRGMFTKATTRDLTKWLEDIAKSKAGASVTESTALQVTAVLACARVISQGVAQVPLKVYQEDEDGYSYLPAKQHPAYKILYSRPNDWMTSFEFRESLTIQAVLTGFGYAWIGRDERNNLIELLPFVSARVKQRQDPDHTVWFEVNMANGGKLRIEQRDMLVLRGPTWDGLEALNILHQAREAIGLAIATEESHARLHANGLQPGGLLIFKQKLTPEIKKDLREDWSKMYEGIQNRFKTLVLDNEAKFESMAMKGVDSQHLETRRFQIEEICRAMLVFPQMIMHTVGTTTFASAEAFFLAHVGHTLQPWVTRWEQVFARDLFPDELDICARFHLQALLRGDAAARAAYYKAGIVDGWLTRNEARRFEELNPLPGLDKPLVPLNMQTLGEDGEPEESVDAPEPEVPPQDSGNETTDPDEETEEPKDEVEKTIWRINRLAKQTRNMLGHNNGPALNRKVGRVLSARNEQRIRKASEELNAVLASLPPEEPTE